MTLIGSFAIPTQRLLLVFRQPSSCAVVTHHADTSPKAAT
jgi:hypothetical protein